MGDRNILILTGAGFGNEIGMPLEKDIMKIGLKTCKKEKPEVLEGLKELWKKINSKHSYTEYSFEDLLTRIMFIVSRKFSQRKDIAWIG